MVRTVCCGLALVASTLWGQTPAPASVREPSSQVSFPVRLTPAGGSTAHELAGTAIRTRTIFRIKVYAFGLYVDGNVARQVLSSYRGVTADRLSADRDFYRRLLDLDVAMTLRLVMTRDVGGSDVADSFDDALKPRVRAAAGRGMPGGDAALAQFRGYFSLEEVAKSTEIVFSCDADGRLTTTVGTAARPEIASRALCWALFDVYLGDRPISSDGKRTLVQRFPGILTGLPPAECSVLRALCSVPGTHLTLVSVRRASGPAQGGSEDPPYAF